jgi:hypothetical protein
VCDGFELIHAAPNYKASYQRFGDKQRVWQTSDKQKFHSTPECFHIKLHCNARRVSSVCILLFPFSTPHVAVTPLPFKSANQTDTRVNECQIPNGPCGHKAANNDFVNLPFVIIEVKEQQIVSSSMEAIA